MDTKLQRKVIFFNGPPRCGKSVGAQYMNMYICDNAPWMKPRIMDFAEPLKKAAHALFSTMSTWDHFDSKEGESRKGLANQDFLGLSPREAYIAVSEQLLKPLCGEAALGYILLKRMIRHAGSQLFIIHNCGFLPELEPIINYVGQENCLLIEVHAVDRDFTDDSRGYIGEQVKERWPKVEVRKLPNTIGDAEDRAFYKLLCQGMVKKFTGVEPKDG